MLQFDLVYQNYISASRHSVDGVEQRKSVPGKPESVAEQQIRVLLPQLLSTAVENNGRALEDYRVYGWVGQPNRSFVKIPWVAALHRDITTSTTSGYYIVLLFREDMQGCVLSLNQGYTEFKSEFGTDEIAAEKIREGAAIALTYLDLPSHFVKGPIDLKASRDLGIGYEQGAIASAVYPATQDVSEGQFLADFMELLRAYDTMRKRIGVKAVHAVSPATEDEFQAAAAELSKSPNKASYVPPKPGPVDPPEKSPRLTGSGYKRDPKVSGMAIFASGYKCEVNAEHFSFISRITKSNFVEAHHLIPMQFQEKFAASLDVLENIVALCPTCHRKLHHGEMEDKKAIVVPLHASRTDGLKSRGLEIPAKTLVALYRAGLDEDE